MTSQPHFQLPSVNPENVADLIDSRHLDSAQTLRPAWSRGSVIAGKYRVDDDRDIGEGGEVVVLRVRDDTANRTLAARVPHGDYANDPAARRRFTRQAEIQTSLSHPLILDAYEIRTVNNRPCVLTEYADGGSLRQHLRNHPRGLPLREGLSIAIQVSWAMEYLHQGNLLHCDLKPDNVLLTRDGIIRLADFGLSQPIDGSEVVPLPGINADLRCQIMGTLPYMAPELLRGHFTRSIDVYAFGVLLFELLSAEWPIAPAGGRDWREAHTDQEPRRLSDIRPEVGGALDGLVAACLAKRPGDRPDCFDSVSRQLMGAVAHLRFSLPFEKPKPFERPPASQIQLAWSMVSLGIGCIASEDLQDAERVITRARAMFEQRDHSLGIALSCLLLLSFRQEQAQLSDADRSPDCAFDSLSPENKVALASITGDAARRLHHCGALRAALALRRIELRVCRELHDDRRQAICLEGQAMILRDLGLHKEAEALAARQRELLSENPSDHAANLINHGLALVASEQLSRAKEMFDQAEGLFRALGDDLGIATALGNQAMILETWGHLDDALELRQRQEQLARRLGNLELLACSIGAQAVIWRERGQLERALQLHAAEWTIVRKLALTEDIVTSLLNQAIVLSRLQRRDEALRCASQAYGMVTEHKFGRFLRLSRLVRDAIAEGSEI